MIAAVEMQLGTSLPLCLKCYGGYYTCHITWDERGLAALQGSTDDVILTPQRPSANGNFGTPSGGAFATPASVASQHSLEDEETLLLDPQVLIMLQPLPVMAVCDTLWLCLCFPLPGHIIQSI